MKKAICVVVGAGPGMGFAIADCFARQGFDIALMSRDETRLVTVAREMAKSHRVRVHAIPLDLVDGAAIAPAIDRVRSELGDPSVLVYNTAGSHGVPAMSLSPADFAHDLGLSVGAALACAQQVFPAMQAAGRGTLLFTGGGAWPCIRNTAKAWPH
jgi:short-subunit dehydrogenase